MESFIESYDLCFADFQQKATEAAALMAGSAALALFLQANGQEAEFTPTDMDMYFQGEEKTQLFRHYLRSHGFEDSHKYDADVECPYADNCIRRVESYVNHNQKEIQLITLEPSHVIEEYIVIHFDLSICATWWIPAENEFKTFNLDATLQKKMYFLDEYTEECRLVGFLSTKQTNRVAKYAARGFEIQLRTQYMQQAWTRDTRKHITCCLPADSGLHGKMAFDVWSYEDVNCIVFLKQSPHHILLKVKDATYGFNRNHLYTYMCGRYAMITRKDYVFQTPMNHSISKLGLILLLHGELSIYELIDETAVMDFRGEPKSVYTVRGYHSSHWLKNKQIHMVAAFTPSVAEDLLPDVMLPVHSPILERSNAVDGSVVNDSVVDGLDIDYDDMQEQYDAQDESHEDFD